MSRYPNTTNSFGKLLKFPVNSPQKLHWRPHPLKQHHILGIFFQLNIEKVASFEAIEAFENVD